MAEIEVEKLRKRDCGHRVEEASFVVEEGEIFGMVGPNISGETTTAEGVNGPRLTAGRLSPEVRT